MSFPRLPLKYLVMGITALVLVAGSSGSETNGDVLLVLWVLIFYAALAGWVRQDVDRENREKIEQERRNRQIDEFFDKDRYELQQTDTYPMEY